MRINIFYVHVPINASYYATCVSRVNSCMDFHWLPVNQLHFTYTASSENAVFTRGCNLH